MKLNSKYLVFIFFTSSSTIFSLETWYDFNFARHVSKTTLIELNQELEFKNGTHDFYWYQLQCNVLQTDPAEIIGAGTGLTYAREKNDHKWVNELVSDIFSRQNLNLGILRIFAQELVAYRMKEKSKKHFFVSLLGGVFLLDNSLVKLSLSNHTEFNYYGHHKIDATYSVASLTLPFFKALQLGIYYIFYMIKPHRFSSWHKNNVLGLIFNSRF